MRSCYVAFGNSWILGSFLTSYSRMSLLGFFFFFFFLSFAYVFYFRYHALILEALSTLKEPNGTDISAIHHFIEVSALCVENG